MPNPTPDWNARESVIWAGLAEVIAAYSSEPGMARILTDARLIALSEDRNQSWLGGER